MAPGTTSSAPPPALSGADIEAARGIIAARTEWQGATLPILHALQDAFGYVPPECDRLIADALNLSRAEVYGVISFYHDFRRTPAGRHVLKLCRGEACQAVGGAALGQRVLARLGIEWGGTSRDGGLTVEPAYCLGLCACAPAALLDGEPLARLDDAAVAEAVRAAGVA